MTPLRVRRAFDRAAMTYDQAAMVQQQTLSALVEALPTQLAARAGPATVLDVGCGTGLALPLLDRRYPGSRLLAVDFSEAMLRTPRGGVPDAANPRGHSGGIPSGHSGGIPSGHSGGIPSGHTGEIPSGHTGGIPPGHTGEILCGHSGEILCGDSSGIPLGDQAASPFGHNLQKIVADAARLPFADACADLVFSSMAWQWCPLPAVLGEAYRVLKPGGTLAFSTLTRGTFRELAAAFSGIDQHAHTLRLLGADEVAAAVHVTGFAAPAVRPVTRTARYADLPALLHAIRATGANEISGRRRPGLLGKTAWKTIVARYAAQADADGLLPLTYEVLEVVCRR